MLRTFGQSRPVSFPIVVRMAALHSPVNTHRTRAHCFGSMTGSSGGCGSRIKHLKIKWRSRVGVAAIIYPAYQREEAVSFNRAHWLGIETRDLWRDLYFEYSLLSCVKTDEPHWNRIIGVPNVLFRNNRDQDNAYCCTMLNLQIYYGPRNAVCKSAVGNAIISM